MDCCSEMQKTFDYPQFFGELMDRAAKAKRLPIDKEQVEIFWDHVKKYSTDPTVITRAINEVIEKGDYLDPGNIIKYIPYQYPQEKGWPTMAEVEKANKCGIARDCLALIRRLIAGDMGKEQFEAEVKGLREKYPRAF